MLTAWLLAFVLVAYNTVVNLVRPLRGWYTAVNTAIAAALLGSALLAGFGPRELGFGVAAVGAGLRWGAAVMAGTGVIFTAAWLLAPHVPLVHGRLRDRRVAGMSGQQLLVAALVRIPLGTAAFEEIAFRGVLLAAFVRAYPEAAAVVWCSVAFGLWHVGPTIPTARCNLPPGSDRRVAVAVVVGVVATALAGVGFALLRLWSGSLLAPVLAHWGINALALLTAAAQQAQRAGGQVI